jgi:UDP-N-acetylmuramyl pentapeptide phosphotransferase/UDP-N-acetylglucosamine-1-phosphate transferase
MIYLFFLIILLVSELAYFKLADHFNIIDKPNQRSSHSAITLRGGGVIFYVGVLLYFLLNQFQYVWFFAGLTLIASISFADDVKPQSRRLRLVIHFSAMALMFYQWGLFSETWYFALIALVLCTGILNAYNFMDGINGITGGYSLVVATGLWYINRDIRFVDSELIYFVVLSLLVFNFFNFRKKAKCFAGDVGSISIAFILIFLLGLLILKTGDFSYMILLVVYGVDSVLTIIHRLMLKDNIFEPHRKHLFQILANEVKLPHVFVSSIYLILQGLIVVGFMCFKDYSWSYFGGILVVLVSTYILLKKRYFHLH